MKYIKNRRLKYPINYITLNVNSRSSYPKNIVVKYIDKRIPQIIVKKEDLHKISINYLKYKNIPAYKIKDLSWIFKQKGFYSWLTTYNIKFSQLKEIQKCLNFLNT